MVTAETSERMSARDDLLALMMAGQEREDNMTERELERLLETADEETVWKAFERLEEQK